MLINKYAYAKLISKPFVWQKLWTLDLGIMIGHSFVLNWSRGFDAEVNHGLYLQETPSEKMMYMTAYIMHVNTIEYNLNVAMAFVCIFGFSRLLFGLQAFETLGPIITTILFMFADVANFINIWALCVLMFTTVGVVGFQEIAILSKFDTAILFWV